MPLPKYQIDQLPAAEDEAAAITEALADAAAGRVSEHQDIQAWLKSWGKPDELPPPSAGRWPAAE